MRKALAEPEHRYYYVHIMAKMIGYMITWTTYGAWLQGNERGYVKKGKVFCGNAKLQKSNVIKLEGKAVRLDKKSCAIVREAILNEAEKLGQVIYSLAVCSSHVHLVAGGIDETVGKVAGRYKRAATTALRANGFVEKVWTKGYDKRYCFDEESLKSRIGYVQGHNR